jgi:hypothetical protein
MHYMPDPGAPLRIEQGHFGVWLLIDESVPAPRGLIASFRSEAEAQEMITELRRYWAEQA